MTICWNKIKKKRNNNNNTGNNNKRNKKKIKDYIKGFETFIQTSDLDIEEQVNMI